MISGQPSPKQVPDTCTFMLVLCLSMRKQGKPVVEIFRQRGGILRMSEALQAGISRRTLYSMHDNGVLDRLSRDLYRLTSLPGVQGRAPYAPRVPGYSGGTVAGA